jgi:hypothetical protein
MRLADRLLARDFVGGVLFAAFGVATTVIASGYSIGSSTRMGPGYFPLMVGSLIVVFGLILAIAALTSREPQPRVPTFALRPLLFIIAAIAVFAALVDSLGVITAVAAMVIVARLSRIDGTLAEVAVTIVALCAIAVLVFVYGLNMPLQMWPW